MRDADAMLTRSEVLKRLCASLRFNKHDLVPQLECPALKMKKQVLECLINFYSCIQQKM